MIDGSSSLFERTIPSRHLVLARISFGVLLAIQSAGAIRQTSQLGYFGEHFHIADLPEALVATKSVYGALLAVRLVASLLVIFGRSVGPACAVSGFSLIYTFVSDRLQFHHNRYSLALFAILLALSAPTGWGREAVRAFPIWLARVQVSLIYLASSGSKLLDADWRSGLVLGDRISRHRTEALARGVPEWLLSNITSPRGSSLLALLAIVTELGLAVMLWNERWRKRAIYVGLVFHALIEVTSRVELFSWVMLSAYVFFVTPDVRARKLHYENRSACRAWIGALRGLDWLGRFEFVPFEPDRASVHANRFVLVLRDGSSYAGRAILGPLASAVPLLFPLWPIFAALSLGSRRGLSRTPPNDGEEQGEP